ncbi:brain protein I3-like [Mercenaria mercenaria]|uniref:brain protein I3-like n=1 Tax=Mercenaria mercenaria TaxID=6596 RepID=UPI001E1DD2EE|nr:brain protein I3-like [Mercenaria mercenaria]XP_045214674.1 brain protein I3-like [Mercenaria mercenaria]
MAAYPPAPNQQAPPPPAPYAPGQPHPGYAPYGQPYGQPSNVVVISQPGVPRGAGNCAYCGIGFVRTQYTLPGLLLFVIFFPIGIVCCLMMTERRCSHCGTKC